MSEDFPMYLAGIRAGSLLAGYRLEAHVGKGGMAVVFRARDERLDRLVALKILAPELTEDQAFRRRFIAESRAAAAVDDPHILPVYEAGEADGVLFIAMRFVRGGDLRRVLEREGALPPVRAAAFISPVASALDAAHAAGLVHRDVKPANILVDARPNRPDHVYLSDFGVSKRATASVRTGTGLYLGTPDYSAPEQIRGREVDGRADQYALGCVAYQLLTGQVPFERDQGIAVLLAHLSEPPPSLGARLPGLSGAADQVLARALAKVPEKRYGSCEDFADALREALGLAPYTSPGLAAALDHPRTEITPPPGFPGPDGSGAGKSAVPAERAAAATIDGLPGGGSLGAAVVPSAEVIVTGPAHPGTGAEDGAVAEQGIPAAALAPAASQPAAESADATDDLTAGQPTLSDLAFGGAAAQPPQRPPRSTADRRGILPAWIRRHPRPAVALGGAVVAVAVVVPLVLVGSQGPSRSQGSSSSHGHPRSSSSSSYGHSETPIALNNAADNGWITSVAFSPAGTILAAAGSNTDLWSVTSQNLIATLNDPNSMGVGSVAFSPNGAMLAAADQNHSTYLWNIATQTLTATFTDPDSKFIYSVAFSADGKILATGDKNGKTYLWNIATKKLTATLTDPGSNGVDSVAFSRDGTLATADGNGSAYLWNVATKKLTASLADPGGVPMWAVAFSPNGKTVATGDGSGAAYLWNVATQSVTGTLTDPASMGVNAVAFSPNGKTVVTGDLNGSAYLWNVATQSLTATLRDPNSKGVYTVAFSPTGTAVATGDENYSTYLWRFG